MGCMTSKDTGNARNNEDVRNQRIFYSLISILYQVFRSMNKPKEITNVTDVVADPGTFVF